MGQNFRLISSNMENEWRNEWEGDGLDDDAARPNRHLRCRPHSSVSFASRRFSSAALLRVSDKVRVLKYNLLIIKEEGE